MARRRIFLLGIKLAVSVTVDGAASVFKAMHNHLQHMKTGPQPITDFLIDPIDLPDHAQPPILNMQGAASPENAEIFYNCGLEWPAPLDPVLEPASRHLHCRSYELDAQCLQG